MNIDNVIKNLNTQNDTHIVIGVSAGPDSMALLHSAITNLNKTIIFYNEQKINAFAFLCSKKGFKKVL